MISKKQIEGLRRAVKGKILTNQPMRERTSLRTGGLADVIVFPKDTEDIIRTIKYLNVERLPYLVLGNGTNLLVKDGGIGDVVISLSDGFKRIELLDEDQSDFLFAEASAPLAGLIRFSIDHSLSGLEFAAGIPGTVGGGLVMNAGGSFGELKDVTHSITILEFRGGITIKKRKDLRFSYRNLELTKGSIVLNATFELKIDKRSRIEEKVRKTLIKRNETQPLDLPSAGSIFKNPRGIPAGKLIDQAGLKGRRIGGAVVSELHANFILNLGNATASDILSLMEDIQGKVHKETGLMLEPEIRVVGED